MLLNNGTLEIPPSRIRDTLCSRVNIYRDTSTSKAWNLDEEVNEEINTRWYYFNNENQRLLEIREIYEYYAKQVSLKL